MSERRFPIQHGLTIPWTMAERAYDYYAERYGRDQTLERLAERGGFGINEWACLYWRHRLQIGQDCSRDCVPRAVTVLVEYELTQAAEKIKAPEARRYDKAILQELRELRMTITAAPPVMHAANCEIADPDGNRCTCGAR